MHTIRISALAALLSLSLPWHAIAQKKELGGKENGEEWQIEQREHWFRKTHDLDVEDASRARRRRTAAVEATRARLEAGAVPRTLAAQWTSVGPSPMTMQGWAMGTVAGRVNGVAIDPADPSVIYVAAAGGGVWKTVNGGGSWTAVFDMAGTQNIGAVAVSPTSSSVVWVGTGDAFDYAGMGVFRSTDAGATWAARNGSGGTMNLSRITSLVLHPTDPDVVIVSGTSGGGIYRTADAGATWSQVLASATYEVVRDPGNANVLYAAVTGSDCHKSTDGGLTWVNASTGIGSGGRAEVAVSPSSPQTLYLVNDASDLYRSTDGAATWTLRNGNACEGQCTYNMTIEVSLADANTLYVGTIRHSKSTNGGTSLTALTAGWGSSQVVHQDTHVIRRHPTDPNTIFVGTDGGLWKTTNAGSSYTNLNGNMNMTMFYDVATHPTLDTVMLGGSQDNSSEAYTGNPLWDVVEVTGDGFVNAINRSNTSYCYVASYPSGGPSVYRSTGGVNGNYNVVTGAIGDNASWVTPYMLDPVTPDTIYLGTTRIWRSTNRGTSWTSISSTLGGGTMVSLAVGKNDNSVIYAGAGSSRVFRSTDTGGSWVDVRGNLPGSHTVNDIEVDPADPLHVYLAISGTTDPNVWSSAAGGTTWTSATNGLPGVTANSVLVVPGPYRIYVGTDIGVFRSDAGDAGPYLPDMAGMALGVAVTDLEHNPTTGTLTAGTWGRGAWQSFATCAPPAADFTGSPTSGTPPLSVTFTDQSTNAPTSWAWDFGDGGTSTSQNPTHVYGAVGTYTVSLTASNSCGADTETKVGYVTVSTCPLPSTDFSGTPTSGTAPLTVAFTDLTSGSPASWSWAFGDGGTSAVQSPTHVYTAPGTYDVSLTTTNACGADTETKLGYVTVTGAGGTTEEVVTGAGAGATNAPVVKAWDHAMPPAAVATFTAYGTPQYGANVATADMNGGGAVEIATGPGPGAVYGPQIRGFLPSGSALGKVNFFAYGTLRYGAAVGGGNVDGDAHGEILTGAGPGAVFGPHVRGWNVDAGSATPMARVSFFAYGTLRYGVRVAGGDVEDDGFAEILTGAGAGSVFAPHVRGFDYDGGAIAALPINVFAFPAGRYGACVGAASTDMDAAAEIVASHGPDPTQGGDVVGYDFTGAGVAVSFAVNAFAALGGAEVAAGDMDGDGRAELVAGAGWGAANASEVRLFAIGGGGGTLLASFPAYPGQSYGTKVAAADTGTP